MSVVKINVLTVPEPMREVLEQRFASRAGEVDRTPGFESFQLLRPTDDSDRYFVVTTWETEAAFDAWMASREFQESHAKAGGADAGSGHAGGGHPGGGHPGSEGAAPAGPRPAASGSELLSFDVVLSSVAQG